jgi:hypothetical protein
VKLQGVLGLFSSSAHLECCKALVRAGDHCSAAQPCDNHLENVFLSIITIAPDYIKRATMSFGTSVGDFIAIGQLTWIVYRACKGAPGEFNELSRELSSLHTILHELEDETTTPNSLLNRRGGSRKGGVGLLLSNISDVVRQIRDIVNRYNSLGRDQKRTWDRIKFTTEDLMSRRAKLTFHMNGLTLFIASLPTGSLARIERGCWMIWLKKSCELS